MGKKVLTKEISNIFTSLDNILDNLLSNLENNGSKIIKETRKVYRQLKKKGLSEDGVLETYFNANNQRVSLFDIFLTLRYVNRILLESTKYVTLKGFYTQDKELLKTTGEDYKRIINKMYRVLDMFMNYRRWGISFVNLDNPKEFMDKMAVYIKKYCDKDHTVQDLCAMFFKVDYFVATNEKPCITPSYLMLL